MTISFHEAENSSFQEVLKLNADAISNLCMSIRIYTSTVFENYDIKGESVTAHSVVKTVNKFFSPIINLIFEVHINRTFCNYFSNTTLELYKNANQQLRLC
jgi:hypothetical protein